MTARTALTRKTTRRTWPAARGLRDRNAVLYLAGVAVSGFGTPALWPASGVWAPWARPWWNRPVPGYSCRPWGPFRRRRRYRSTGDRRPATDGRRTTAGERRPANADGAASEPPSATGPA